MSKITALLAGAILLPAAANAATTIDQRGTKVLSPSGQTYNHNDQVPPTRFNGSTDPAPFDVLDGQDSVEYFDVSWSHTYGPLEGTFTSSVIEIGIWDIDSDVMGNQVRLFTLNGVDLTAALNAVVEGNVSGNGRYGIYQLNLPTLVGSGLLGGTANFRLSLENGFSLGQVRTFNGAILDYSKLTINTQIGGGEGPGGEGPGGEDPIPEPATWAMMIAGFGLSGAAMRRRRVKLAFA